VDFSLFYFADDAERTGGARYRLLLDGARLADRLGLAAVWTPERHYHRFGGLYPDPAVTGAALAAVTERVQIRAGSVVAPLHDPLEIVEKWSVVDNLSGGRVGLSLASGWHATDFATRPDSFAPRRQLVVEAVEQIRHLWSGGDAERTSGTGEPVRVRAFPPPVRADLPMWLTSAGSVETFRAAGRAGVGVLTYLVGQSETDLKDKIQAYRTAARQAFGHQWSGHVVVMAHVYLDHSREQAQRVARDPLLSYLRSSLDLNAGSTRRGADAVRGDTVREDDVAALLARSLADCFDYTGIIGTVAEAADRADALAAVGVDEIACLIDFGMSGEAVLESVRRIGELNREFHGEPD
jgi:natural product biosynthesis luciferase-like monooxygenase protein